jgi:hypothetical protein
MAQQTLNLGTAPNDGTGDSIRDGGDKINDNFSELYTAGEYVATSRDSGSALTLASLTAANVTSISLPAGDWDVRGNVTFQGGGSVSTLLQTVGSISSTSATLDTAPGHYSAQWLGSGVDVGTSSANVVLGPVRVNLESPQTLYLIGRASFSGNAVKAYGILEARRCTVG